MNPQLDIKYLVNRLHLQQDVVTSNDR